MPSFWWSISFSCFMRKGSSAGIFESVDVRNSKDLTEAEEVKKRWQEYIEELHTHRKVLMAWETDGVVTHLGLDIVE